MKRRFLLSCMIIVNLVSLFLKPASTYADSSDYLQEKHLNIATIDSRPISIDRLLYTAFKDIGYQSSFTITALQTGYSMANDGEKDGVIASTPDIEETYHNLIKVPLPIETIYLYAFIREDSDLKISSWADLSGYKVGINTQRPFIASQIPDDATIFESDTVTQVMEGLSRGDYDVAVLSHRAHETLRLQSGLVRAGLLGELTDYLYLNKNYEYLMPEIAGSLNAIFKDGRGENILDDIPILEEGQKKTVLHIISSNMQVTREEQLNKKLREPFEDDMSIDWYTIELNFRRFSRASDRLVYVANLLRQDTVSRNIAAIVVSGEDGLQFLTDYYYLFFRNVPVLFYGIGDQYQTIIEGYEQHFTGIVENLSAFETVENALRLFPNTKNLYVINDYTSEGHHYRLNIDTQLAPFAESIAIEHNENISCGALLEYVRKLPQDSLVFVGSYFCDADGQHFPLNEMKRLMEKDCSVPIFSLYSTSVEYNAVGGKCLDYEKNGEVIADMLKRLLNGENSVDMPIITNTENYNRWVFDKNMLDRMGIEEKALPAGAQVLNKIPSIWESDPKFAITLVLLIIISTIVIIGVSVYFIQYRKQKELKLKDAKIREVKERLERVISTAPVSYAMCVDGVVVEINENMKTDTGIGVDSRIVDIYDNPEERAPLINRVMKEGFIKNEVIRYKFSSGKIHRCLLNMAHADYEGQNAIVAWIIDIEQDELKKDQLSMARQSLQTIIDTMPAPVGIIDMEDIKIVYGNNAFLRLLEFDSFDDFQKFDVHEALASVRRNRTDSFTQDGKDTDLTETIMAEVQSPTAKGNAIDVRVLTSPIDYKGRKAIISILTDLAQEKEYQRMLFRTAEKEREANLLKSRFLVNMSHEIRTPMNAIIGLTEIELHKKLSGEAKEIYKKVNTSAKNLLEIINDILDLSKIEADKIELFEDEFELEEVLNSALLVASPRLDGKNVEFMLNAALNLPRFVMGDRTRVWQILKNFLDNSAKYTEKGKIVLTVYIDKEQSNDEIVTLVFIIEDTGIGIGEAQMQKLFMPYEQIYNEAQKRYSGTGLGMPISKRLCEIMGGKLQVESRLGEGTTIHLSIPFRRSQNGETELQVIKAPSLAGTNILAVDDDQLSLDIMSSLLEGNDVNCTLAKSGIEAMDIVLSNRDMGKAFDIILLDYMMEGMNGLETAKQINLALSKAPKLLMVTAYQKLLMKSELEQNGIDDILEKPFIPSQFIHKLCATLGYENAAADETTEVFMKFKDAHVLLCEDYSLNQEVATGMFAQFGVVSTIAENGKECIEILDSGKTFDLIFMDLQMPVMDGYEATRIIRADPRFDNTPIISLTADAMKEIVDKCMEMGMDDHIAKPIEFDSLKRVFQKWLPESKRIFEEQARPALDTMNEGLARFGGNRERYENALRKFEQMLPEEWADFKSAVQNSEETKQYIHKLKGVSGNLALEDIYRYSAEFEKSLLDTRPDSELYERLIDASNKFKKSINEK